MGKFNVTVTAVATDAATGEKTGERSWTGYGLTAQERNAVHRAILAWEAGLIDASDSVNKVDSTK